MDKDKIKEILNEYITNIIGYIGPIVFAIVDANTGSWFLDDNTFKISLELLNAKRWSIIIALIYLISLTTATIRKIINEHELVMIKKSLVDLQQKSDSFKMIVKSLENLISFTKNQIREQMANENKNSTFIQINGAINNVCQEIYGDLSTIIGSNNKITVNGYIKKRESGKRYSIMIAHEGKITQVDRLGEARIYKGNAGKDFFCDKLLYSNKADHIFLDDKKKVAKAFGKKEENCNYNQYLGIPIKQYGGENIALIEIIAHYDYVIWNNSEDALGAAEEYFSAFKEYLLLWDTLEKYSYTRNILSERGNENVKTI